MPCQPCQTIRKHYPSDPQRHLQHCPTCIHCGARLIQKLQRLYQLTAEQRRDRCRQVLAQWLEMGHSETELRKLAKATAWAIAPAARKA